MPDEAQGQIGQDTVAKEEKHIIANKGALVDMIQLEVLQDSLAICNRRAESQYYTIQLQKKHIIQVWRNQCWEKRVPLERTTHCIHVYPLADN